jgi:uncharacterized protein
MPCDPGHSVENGAPLLGLISDTHGLLRPEALELLRPCTHIVHAGDVGGPEILAQLESVAPVTAIRGNVDSGAWADELPVTAAVQVGDLNIYVVHDVHDLDLNPVVAGIDLVVSGHSHRPGVRVQSGVCYLNPGSAGPRRFQLPITLARMRASRPSPSIELVDIITGEISKLA